MSASVASELSPATILLLGIERKIDHGRLPISIGNPVSSCTTLATCPCGHAARESETEVPIAATYGTAQLVSSVDFCGSDQSATVTLVLLVESRRKATPLTARLNQERIDRILHLRRLYFDTSQSLFLLLI
jgi:hypothetical protein